MKTIEKELKNFLDRKFTDADTPTAEEAVDIFYRSQMSSMYKQEETNLHQIVSNYLHPVGNRKVKLHIYYKPMKMKNLFIRNNPHTSLHKSHVVYQYKCNHQECQPQDQTYIGYTECTLTDRCRNHAQSGSILQHNVTTHHQRITTKQILEATEVLYHLPVKEELIIAEALFIKQEHPTLNNQREGEYRVLTIF